MKGGILFFDINKEDYLPLIRRAVKDGFTPILNGERLIRSAEKEGVRVVNLGGFIPNVDAARDAVKERIDGISEIIRSDQKTMPPVFRKGAGFRNEFLKNLANLMTSQVLVIETMEVLTSRLEIDLIALGCDNSHIQRALVEYADLKGIPTIQIAHGLFNRPVVQFAGNIPPLYSDHITVFGKRSRQIFLEDGTDPDRVFLTGSVEWDSLYHAKRSLSQKEARTRLGLDPDKPVILFCGTYADGASAFFSPVCHRLFEIHGALIEAIKNLGQEVQLLIRPHPLELKRAGISSKVAAGFIGYYAEWLARQGVRNLRILTGHKVESILAADIVIGMNNSSMMAESMILERPVIKMSFGEWDSNTFSEDDGLTVLEEPDRLPESLKRLISSRAQRQEAVKRQNAGLEDLNHGNDGKAGQRVYEVISGLASRKRKERLKASVTQEVAGFSQRGAQERLKILEVVHNFPPFQVGGTELYTFHLAKEFKEMGHDVTVLFPVFDRNLEDYSFKPFEYDGLKTIRFNQFGKNKKSYSDYLNMEFDDPFREFLKQHPFDVVHFQHLYGLSANWITIARDQGSRTILKIDDLFFLCRQIHLNTPDGNHCSGPESVEKCYRCSFRKTGQSDPAIKKAGCGELSQRREVLKTAYSRPHMIHTPSDFAKTIHEKYGFENKNVRVIPTGIWPFDVKEKTRPSDGKIRVAYVGAIDRRKGIGEFLSAVELFIAETGLHSNLNFQIYGNHNSDVLFESMISKTSEYDCLEYCGKLDPSNRSELFAKIDLLVSPSIGENYPFLLREALYAGVPVAATRIAGVAEIVQEGKNGFLFPPNDPASLAEIFRKISERPETLSELITGGSGIRTIFQEANELARLFVQTDAGVTETIPKISIIIVTYNSEETINHCLSSIPGSTRLPFEVLLIDNHSIKPIRDSISETWIREDCLKIIENPENLGFSRAANQGIKCASGEHIVLLNPDCTLSGQSLDLMRNHFEQGVAAVGPLSNYAAGGQNLFQYNSMPIGQNIALEEISKRLFEKNQGRGIETKLLIGFCLMLKKSVLDHIGLLDEDLFLGNDDLDLSLRIADFGYKLIVATDTVVYHKGQVSFATLENERKSRLMQDSLDRFYTKLEKKFGPGRVPSSTEIWGLDILGIPSKFLGECNPIIGGEESGWGDRKVAIIYDNVIRPDTTGEYCNRALSTFCRCDHYLPSQLTELSGTGYDLFLYIDDGLQYEIPLHLRPNAWWVIDTHLQYDIDLKKARRFDFVFAAQKDGAAKLRRDGIKSARWLPLAADPDIHKKHPVEKVFDVAFVGHIAEGPRNDLIETIKSSFDNVFIGRKFFDEMAQIYSQSRIVFNRSIRNDVNMRVFEAMSCGSLLITNRLSENGQNELFKPGFDFVEYQDEKDLLGKIRDYLEDEESRERIAAAGRASIQKNHTYTHRMKGLINTILNESRGLRNFGEDDGLVSIIVVTFNGMEATRRCMESVHEFTDVPFELIVVDNGSTDGTLEYLEELPDRTLIKNKKNLGFAAANNIGIEQSKGEYVLLLNNDTILTSGWLRRLKRAIDLAPEIGLAGPMTNHAYSFVQCIEKGKYDDTQHPEEFAGDFARQNKNRFIPTIEKLVAFCILIKREVIEEIGVLDEEYGAGNFEDDDFCLRARLAGFGSMVAGEAFVYHEGSHSFKKNHIDYQKMMKRNLEIFKTKWKDQIEFRGDVYYLKDDLKQYALNEIRLGEDAFNQEDNEAAREHFLKALEWEPESPAALNNLGVLDWQHGKTVGAAEYFMKALRKMPTYTDAIENLIQISTNTQLPDKTLKEIYQICRNNKLTEETPV